MSFIEILRKEIEENNILPYGWTIAEILNDEKMNTLLTETDKKILSNIIKKITRNLR